GSLKSMFLQIAANSFSVFATNVESLAEAKLFVAKKNAKIVRQGFVYVMYSFFEREYIGLLKISFTLQRVFGKGAMAMVADTGSSRHSSNGFSGRKIILLRYKLKDDD